MNVVFRDVCELAVVGAGPYGLSLAAHLQAAGIETRVFGDPLSFWRNNMPRGMQVRSAWQATHLVDPDNRFSLDAYAAATGLGRLGRLTRDDFIRYGDWFQGHAVPDLDRRKVAQIDATERGFLLRLEDGHGLHAGRIVVATGLAHHDYRPPQFSGLPARLVSHTGAHHDLSRFRDRRVAVIGRGQSGCESAALLAEAGAEVRIITRDPVQWLGAEAGGVAPFGLGWLATTPDLYRRLPTALRAAINRRSLRPTAAVWLKPRLAGVTIDGGRRVYGGRANGTRVLLDIDNCTQEFDHIMLATGYRVDIGRLDFLGPALLAAIATDNGAPILSHGYESSVRGLHFIGASAVHSYGPQMRFVAGAGCAARTVTAFVRARRSTRAARSISHMERTRPP